MIKVSQGIYRGPHPNVAVLHNAGIKTVLTLENDISVVADEVIECKKNDIDIYHQPMSDFFRPSKPQLIRVIQFLSDPDLYPIYVHCRLGVDRTGMAIAAYRILIQDWTVDEAYAEAKKLGHRWWFPPYWGWKRSLEELIDA